MTSRQNYYSSDPPPKGGGSWTEYDCPECDANNPMDFKIGDEVLCMYCERFFDVVAKGERGYELKES